MFLMIVMPGEDVVLKNMYSELYGATRDAIVKGVKR